MRRSAQGFSSALLLLLGACGGGGAAESTDTDRGETDAMTASEGGTDGGSGPTGGTDGSDGTDSADPTGGGDDGDEPTGGGDDTSGGEEEPEVYACTFEDRPQQWSLPGLVKPGYEPYTSVADDIGCGAQEGSLRYQVFDITGDGALDLVVTDNCDPAGAGTTRWDVYESDGNGFAEQPTQWSLPQLVELNYEPYTSITDDIGCGQQEGSLRYQVLDITGDGAPDLVVTDNCDAAGAGTTRWDVYENNGSGFADQPTPWALPQLVELNYEPYIFTTDDVGCGQQGVSLRYQVLDITGDGAPDFVVTDSCDAAGAGTTRWDVYENDGSGFADQPTQWALPQLVELNYEPYIFTTDDVGCGVQEGALRYQVLDITGDRAPDLVVTDSCDAAGAGTTRWDVYENTGSGFAEQATQWSLPQLVELNYEPYIFTADDVGCGAQEGSLRYQVLDVSGDRAPDLVVTDNCDPAGAGTTRWDVYENDGSGFATEATPWALPQLVELNYEPYIAIADDVGCGGQEGQLRYLVMDLSADGAPDFVLTDNCDAQGTGTTHWTFFEATCAR